MKSMLNMDIVRLRNGSREFHRYTGYEYDEEDYILINKNKYYMDGKRYRAPIIGKSPQLYDSDYDSDE